jgi:hypothetical protein
MDWSLMALGTLGAVANGKHHQQTPQQCALCPELAGLTIKNKPQIPHLPLT